MNILLKGEGQKEHGSAKESVAILLCTYNGERFLKEQLDSIINQTYKHWKVYVSDDGSTDLTLDILEEYKLKLPPGKINILHGPRQGFAKNFLSLVKCESINADFFAFSDQDDRWCADRLERGINRLENTPAATPALYCSTTRLINMAGETIGQSPGFSKAPSFQNALVQSLAGANTMLVNQSARILLSKTPDDIQIPAHDWLAYLLVSGAGGTIVFDKEPTIEYRQHDRNLIGANTGIKAKMSRLKKMFSGRFKEWNSQNIVILENARHTLSKQNLEYFNYFTTARQSGLLKRIFLTFKSGVYRQTASGSASLWVAVILNRI
jgi:glycosyltransferase involved in cell wall biosynthesis